MSLISIEDHNQVVAKLQANIDAIQSERDELLLHLECSIEAYDNAIILESGGMEDSIRDARAYITIVGMNDED
jgi:hypothetical protein